MPKNSITKTSTVASKQPSDLFWRIQGTVTVTDEDAWQSSVQVPTFFIHPGWQGASKVETVLEIARNVVDPCHIAEYISLTAFCEETGEYQDMEWNREDDED